MAETPWPEAVDDADYLSRILFRVKNDHAVSRERAIELYIADVNATDDPVAAVAGDLDDIVMAADALAEAAESLLRDEPHVGRADIATLETAITELRSHREMFAAAFRTLEKEGAANARVTRDEGAAKITAAVRRLGLAADAIAHRLRDEPEAAAPMVEAQEISSA